MVICFLVNCRVLGGCIQLGIQEILMDFINSSIFVEFN